MTAYEQGFMTKCAEYGVDPEWLMKQAGVWQLAGRALSAAERRLSPHLGRIGRTGMAYGRNMLGTLRPLIGSAARNGGRVAGEAWRLAGDVLGSVARHGGEAIRAGGRFAGDALRAGADVAGHTIRAGGELAGHALDLGREMGSMGIDAVRAAGPYLARGGSYLKDNAAPLALGTGLGLLAMSAASDK